MTSAREFPRIPDDLRGEIARKEGCVLLLPLDAVAEGPLTFLSPEERERAARFQHEPSRKAFVAGRCLLRDLLAEGRDPAGVPLELGPHGKPSCPVHGAPAFNLSHTRGWLGLAVIPHGPVGLDLENEERLPDVERLARRVFSSAEQAWLAPRDEAAFFELWTRKEAWSKATGKGFSAGFGGFDTLEAEREGRWSFQTFRPDGDTRGCVATPGPPRRFVPRTWDPDRGWG